MWLLGLFIRESFFFGGVRSSDFWIFGMFCFIGVFVRRVVGVELCSFGVGNKFDFGGCL